MVGRKTAKGKSRENAMPRTSVSFPPEVYKTLEDMARKKKVSMGWVVREAVDKYIADQWPLLAKLKEN
jgi:metal-responsive CopG/Arc/MetJ family transcriptional regulator